MKKINYLAFAALATAMAACSSDEGMTTATDGSAGVNDGLEQIQLTISNPASMVASKGTGAVGGITEEENKWKGERVNIYMLEKGTMNLAYFNETDREGGSTKAIYNGAEFITPIGTVSDVASDASGSIKYYPPTGTYDFWGYRLDDCELGSLTQDEEKISVPFTLNGSQDIMVGKAELTVQQQQEASQDVQDRAYSAFAARNNVQPDITFRHLLTRLTFQAIAKEKNVCDPATGVYIDAVEIKAKNQGTLTLAYTDAVTDIASYKDQIQMNDEEATLLLKDKQADADGKLIDLIPVQPQWNTEEDKPEIVEIGESFMIPAADKYELVFHLRQSKPSKVGGEPEAIKYEMPYTLYTSKSDNPSPFLIGYSYNVQVTINGLKEIEITTTLEPWGDGGDIEINPEDENI